jgi:hypothetical protein
MSRRFSGWNLRGAALAGDLALLARFGLHLQYFQNQRKTRPEDRPTFRVRY